MALIQERNRVVVVGGTPVALLTALFFNRAGRDVVLIDPTFGTLAPFCNPDLGLIGGGDSLSELVLQALQAWSTEADVLGDETFNVLPWLDVATQAAVAERIREESVLDVLSGYGVAFKETYPGFSSQLKGVKVWAEAPLLPFNLVEVLRKAIRTANIEVLEDPVVGVDVTQPEAPLLQLASGTWVTASPLVLACAATATQVLGAISLPVPMRPACGHVLVLQPQTPVPPFVMVNRLKRGHMWMFPSGRTTKDDGTLGDDGTVTLFYDAVVDAAQARYGTKLAPEVVKMLQGHIAGLVPALAAAEARSALGVTHWVTPDFMPVVGRWPAIPGLILACGWGGRETVFAPLAAQWLVQIVTQPDAALPSVLEAFLPNRFATGLWQRVLAPGSLMVVYGSGLVRRADNRHVEYMSNVRMTGNDSIQRAAAVKEVEHVKTKPTKVAQVAPIAQTPRVREKPRIQTAAVKAFDR